MLRYYARATINDNGNGSLDEEVVSMKMNDPSPLRQLGFIPDEGNSMSRG